MIPGERMTTEEMIRLRETRLAPYIQLATLLIGKSRFGGGNMFRHQLDTMAILVDYSYIDSILLKAAIVHDVLEDIPILTITRCFRLTTKATKSTSWSRKLPETTKKAKPNFLPAFSKRDRITPRF